VPANTAPAVIPGSATIAVKPTFGFRQQSTIADIDVAATINMWDGY